MIFNFYTISAFINFLTSVVFAVLVVLKNKKNPKNIGFFILASLVGMWSLCYFFWQNSMDSEVFALFWSRALMVFTIMIPAAYLHFVLALTDALEKRKKLLIFTYLLFYLFLLTDATPFFIEKVGPVMNFNYWPIATPIMSLWLFCFVLYVFYSSFLLIKKYKESGGITKIQLRYVSIGIIIAFICGTLNFVPWYKIPLQPYTNAVVPIYVILMAYAITRYRFMDIRTLTKNIVFYFIIAVLAYVSFYFMAHFYKIVFGNPLAKEGYVLGLIIAPVFAIIIYNSGKILSDFLKKNIFYSLYVYEQAIKKAQVDLSHYKNLGQISDIIIDTIKKALQTDKIAVLVYDDAKENNPNFRIVKKIGFDTENISSLEYDLFSEYFIKNQGIMTKEELEDIIESTEDLDYKKLLHPIENLIYKNDISLCAPIKNNGHLFGVVILGEKMYESFYSKEDFNLLKSLLFSAEIAIDNALIYRRLDKKLTSKKVFAD